MELSSRRHRVSYIRSLQRLPSMARATAESTACYACSRIVTCTDKGYRNTRNAQCHSGDSGAASRRRRYHIDATLMHGSRTGGAVPVEQQRLTNNDIIWHCTVLTEHSAYAAIMQMRLPQHCLASRSPERGTRGKLRHGLHTTIGAAAAASCCASSHPRLGRRPRMAQNSCMHCPANCGTRTSPLFTGPCRSPLR